MKNMLPQEYTVKIDLEQDDKKTLKTFKSQLAVTRKKVDGKVIQFQKEKCLLSIFLITSYERRETDLEHCWKHLNSLLFPDHFLHRMENLLREQINQRYFITKRSFEVYMNINLMSQPN